MKPLKLIMTGFESYKDKTEIDFEKSGIRGLFLISGDTGSGKTTIFDAITFALYGSSSGDVRDVEMLRSHFADENTPTEVELFFEAKNKKYHIIRNPDYERKSRKGDGLTTEKANARLDYLSESSMPPLEGSIKVSQEVEKILGLKKDQFCRIAMIAQGKFQELLLSKKDQKEKIFRELFHTEKYEMLQNTLKSRKSEAEKNLQFLKEKLRTLLNQIVPRDENLEEIQKIKDSQYLTEEEILLLEKLEKNDAKKASEISDQLTELDKKLTQAGLLINEGEKRKQTREKLESTKALLKCEEEKLLLKKEELLQSQNKVQELTPSESRAAVIENSLPLYKEIENKAGLIKKALLEINNNEKKCLELLKKKEELCGAIEELKKEEGGLKDAGEKLLTLKGELEKIDLQKEELKALQNNLFKLKTEKEKLKKMQEELLSAQSLYENKNSDYVQKLKLFNMEQAGILAEDLKDNCPCPVCGSLNHPAPAKKSENAPSQNELEKAKSLCEELQNNLTQITARASSQKSLTENLTEQILLVGKKHFEAFNPDASEAENYLEDKVSLLTERQKSINGEILLEEKNKKRRAELEKLIPENEALLSTSSDQYNRFSAETSALKAKTEAENNALNEEKNKLEFKTSAEAEEEINKIRSSIKLAKEAEERAKAQKDECENNISAFKGSIDTLEKSLKEGKEIDYDKEVEKQSELLREKEKLNSERDLLSQRIGINKKCIENIKEVLPEISKADEYYQSVWALSEVASGSSRGKSGKPSLENYVQMKCLDQINRRANLRLRTMTDGKYELCRRIEEDGSELGLDLDIKDFYTGRKRSVQSLSGGEQFQASLSLALGLADEVQEHSGGIKLDSMFIDEGFGTLDSETLNKAMRALEELSKGNKLIGIISHVEELENRIEKKIKVYKDNFGVSRIE